MSYKIALAGNPNSGKTTVFNALTGSRQHVGNWPGVTVEKKDGRWKKDRAVVILDLPGTYSLSPYSEEEKIARDAIINEKPDVLINIVDATSIERNLYLTLQILETEVPTVIALNMMDEVEQRGDKIDVDALSQLMGVPIVPVVARSSKGLQELMEAAIKQAKNPVRSKLVTGIYDAGDSEEVVVDKRYKLIGQMTAKTVKKGKAVQKTRTDKIDSVLTNRWLALPLFAIIMYLVFACTFSENFLFIPGLPSPGVLFAGWVEAGWAWLTELLAGGLESLGAADWAAGLVIDGIMGGIGAVLGFLPLVLVLYVLMSFLEDSGYMARVAFVMDRIFRRFGLSGRSFIPLLMGFGCGVPAIMATRTLESEKDRHITTVVTAFMPCGAKLPIFAFFVSIFFTEHPTLAMFCIYFISILAAIIVSLIMNKVFYRGAVSNFIMELPQYRLPTPASVGIHVTEKLKDFAKKAGSIILVATILIWVLSNFNFDSFNGKNLAASQEEIIELQAKGEEGADEMSSSVMCAMDDSFLASLGGIVAPVFTPLGFGTWKPTVGIVTGWIAKEMVVVTFAQLYGGEMNEDEEVSNLDQIAGGIEQDIKGPVGALAYMVFNLLCMPCFAAVGATKRELKTVKKTLGAVGIQMLTAYVFALLIVLIGGIFA